MHSERRNVVTPLPHLSLLGLYTVSQKKFTSLAEFNFDPHARILTFFGRTVTEKISNQKLLHFPPRLISASALPGKKGNPDIAYFHLSAARCFAIKHAEHITNIT